MYPCTTPPTSWPTPPQPATPSSTWPPQSASIASTPRPTMTWPTTAPPPTASPQPLYPMEPQQYSINPPHMPGTTPTPVEHLFGQPSPLHPTWSSSSSLLPPASTTPSLSFASLATAPHAVPAPHLVPTTTTPLGPDTQPSCTPLHQLHNPNGTNSSDHLAYCSSSFPRIGHTTYTSTGLTLPTSCPSFSTAGRYDIYSSSSCTSSPGSQGSPEASI